MPVRSQNYPLAAGPPPATHHALFNGFPPDHVQAFGDLLCQFPDVPSKAQDFGRTIQHVIRLQQDRPFHIRSYSFSTERNDQVKEMLARGIIESTVLANCSPGVLVKKKQHHTLLHRLSKPQHAHHLRGRADAQALQDLGNATISLNSGSWQIPVKKTFRYLTAFAISDGATYHFRVILFALNNAPGTFQRLMTHWILAGFSHKFTLVYLDDILVVIPDWAT